jgi:hypothetical protein
VTGLVVAAAVYAAVSLRVRHPAPTPLDFRAATAPAYAMLQVATAVLVLTLIAPPLALEPAALVRGYAAGLAFVAAPQIVGIARRECLHQAEVLDLHPSRVSIALRDLLQGAVTLPTLAACEEVVLRGLVAVPEPIVVAAHALVCLLASRRYPWGTVAACAFLGLLHSATGSLALVIAAHAAVQTFTGRLRLPGLFGRVFPLLEQAGWRNLGPAWLGLTAEAAAAALVLGALA